MNILEVIPQVFIALFGAGAVWLVGAKNPKRRQWGYVCGVFAQPFWLWTTLEHHQYGISALCLVYGLGWLRGLKNNWRGA